MQKYRIVPRQENMLWELVQGMRLEPEQRELFKNSSIQHVEVSEGGWEIVIIAQSLIPEKLLSEASMHIAEKCQLKEVIFYQEVVNLEDELNKIWAKIINMAADGNATVFQLLKRSKHNVDGSRVVLDVPGELAGEIMRAHAVTQVMSKAIRKMLGFSCHVICNASDEVLPDIEVDCAFNTPDYVRAVRNERQDAVQEAASSYSQPVKPATPAPKTSQEKKEVTAPKSAPARKDIQKPMVIQGTG